MPVGAYAVASDTGRRRRRNEDNYVVAPPLFAVADGMGGAQAGEVASQLAASALEAGGSDGLSDMVEDEEILELVHANREDLDKAVKALVAAANRGGGEDNITAVAFRISSEAAPSLEDTVSMPALTGDEDEPDEQTREYTDGDLGGDTMVVPPGELAADEADPQAKRVRIVLIGVVVVALVAVLLIWGLSR